VVVLVDQVPAVVKAVPVQAVEIMVVMATRIAMMMLIVGMMKWMIIPKHLFPMK
jgi:hypothetical protein